MKENLVLEGFSGCVEIEVSLKKGTANRLIANARRSKSVKNTALSSDRRSVSKKSTRCYTGD